MDAKRFFVTAVLAAALLALSVSAAHAAEAWEASAQAMYEHGYFLENSQRDYAGALEVYKKVTERFPDDKKYCALALAHIGVCLEAQGKKDEARAAYEKVVKDYADQKDAVALANDRLAGKPVGMMRPRTYGELKDAVLRFLENQGNVFTFSYYETLALAEADPEAAADFFRDKLTAIGKQAGPRAANAGAIGALLNGLAWCDTKKAPEYLLDLLKRAEKPEGQFLGESTADTIYASFMYLRPKYVTDEITQMVIDHIKEVDMRRMLQNAPSLITMYFPPFQGTGVVISGFMTLAVFAETNAKALDYLKKEAQNLRNGERARAAIYSLIALRKPETAEFYAQIATGKFPDDTRRLAIICLGLLGMPYWVMPNAPDYYQAGWYYPFDGAPAIEALQYQLYTANYAFQYLTPEAPIKMMGAKDAKLIYQPEKITDACLKALAAAFDFNNCIDLRGQIIMSLGLLGRKAAAKPLLEYAKNAVDEETREMAVIGLRTSVAGFPENRGIMDAIKDMMKNDRSPRVRIQTAYALAILEGTPVGPNRTSGYVNFTIPREAIPIVLDAVKNYTGVSVASGPTVALGLQAKDALNALLSTTFHGNLLPYNTKPQIDSAVEDFDKWWKENKDKSESEWAMQGLAAWIEKARDYLKLKEDTPLSWPPTTTAIYYPHIQRLIDTAIGRPQVPSSPDSNYGKYWHTQIQMVCDWYDKNKDNITWDEKNHCFVLKPAK